MSLLSDNSIHAWISEHEIKNEKGEPIDFKNHLFLFDIYRDPADNLVVEKPAQVGLSTLEILKNHFDAKHNRMDIIYTLPTDNDVHVFVGGKVNRIIANNPCMLADVADKDSIEQKAIGSSMMYYRGTWSKKAAIMVTADRLVHDEKDSSKQDVVKDYQSRLQHSKFKQTHVFSHPSTPNNGVDIEWQLSDMKEWFIKCPHCNHRQYMSWNTEDPKKMSVDMVRGVFVCKKCQGILSDSDRAVGEWVARKPGAVWSGYHISLLMAPWVSAKEIVDKYNDTKQTIDFFYNKVLGLPYAGSGNAVQEDTILGAVSDQKTAHKGRLVIGVDSGIALRYVIGTKAGLLGYGEMKQWEPDEKLNIPLEQTIEYFLVKFPDSIMVIDQGGDIIGPRKLRAKYPGRVFLCHYRRDRKTMELIQWGKNEEAGNVVVDRNRMIQLVIDEVRERRWRLFQGDRNAWYNYWLHWSHIYRVWEEDELGIRRFQWLRNDRDDFVHATCLDGDTMVTTENGGVKIKDIRRGDYVLTREGFMEVGRAWMTNPDSEVIEATFSNGAKIIGTPTHRIWTENRGFIHLQDLSTDDILVGICNKISTERHTSSTKANDTYLPLEERECIVTCGSTTMEKCKRGITFTTKTTTLSIIKLITSCWSILRSTLHRTLCTETKENLCVWCAREYFLKEASANSYTAPSGVDQASTTIGTTKWRGNVSSVKNDLPPILIGGEPHVLECVRVEKLVRRSEHRAVYNISVEGEHEYFANGVLVSNCYWRIGIDRFGGDGSIINTSDPVKPNSYMLNADGTVSFDPHEMFTLPEHNDEEDEWR